jgi:hypothetical protein
LICDARVGDAFMREQQDLTTKRDLLRRIAVSNQLFEFALLVGSNGQWAAALNMSQYKADRVNCIYLFETGH